MTRIFVDTADVDWIERHDSDPRIEGYTTNPSLMRAADVSDYETAIREILQITFKPISFEVVASDATLYETQAHKLDAMGNNVYVKIPVTTSKGISLCPLITRLSLDGIHVNATAVFTQRQINEVTTALFGTRTSNIISIFAGRISDTGRNPLENIFYGIAKAIEGTQVLWASSRSVYDYYSARTCGCDIITLSPALFDKLSLENYSLEDYSLDTVKQFDDDARLAGFTL